MNKKAKYICIEGTEGVGKTTQTKKLVDYLQELGYKVLQTKEPGTPLAPITMQMRALMLDNQYNEQLTPVARELISQAIRSIHLDKVITPAISEYDFIIQDRGILSGLSYGTACGNDIKDLITLSGYATSNAREHLHDGIYDCIIYLTGNTSVGLAKALMSKQEFAAGDAMESKGNAFMENVSQNMNNFSEAFNTKTINVDNKNIDEVFHHILFALDIKE